MLAQEKENKIMQTHLSQSTSTDSSRSTSVNQTEAEYWKTQVILERNHIQR